MRDGGDAFPLLDDSRAEQRAGCDKQDVIEPALAHERENVPAHDRSRAAAAAAAGMDILFFQVVKHQAAVGMRVLQIVTVFEGEFPQDFGSHLAEVTGDNEVKIFCIRAGILEESGYGLRSGRGRCHNRTIVVQAVLS